MSNLFSLNMPTAWLKKNLLLVLLAIALPYLIIKSLNGGEFNTYLGAAEQLKLGKSCYHVWLQYGNQQGNSQYGYSPLFAALLIPATYLPVWLPPLLFLIADVFMLFSIFNLLFKWLEIDETNKVKVVILTLTFTLRLILHNFEMLQLNIFLLWLTLQSVDYIFCKNKTAFGSALLAFGINIKILPVVFIPYLIWRRKMAATFCTIVFVLVSLLATAVVWGFDFNAQLHQEWWAIINPLNEKYNSLQNLESYRLHGLSALIAAYFSKSENNTFQLLLADLPPKILTALINGARVVLILLFVLIAKMPFKPSITSKQITTETAYLLLVTPLIFPQQNKWAFVYLIPSFVVVFNSMFQNGFLKRRIELALLLVAFALLTLTTDGLIGKNLAYYAECLKLLTIGTLFVVPLLFIANVKNNKHSLG